MGEVRFYKEIDIRESETSRLTSLGLAAGALDFKLDLNDRAGRGGCLGIAGRHFQGEMIFLTL